jgi:hypothetical protein
MAKHPSLGGKRLAALGNWATLQAGRTIKSLAAHVNDPGDDRMHEAGATMMSQRPQAFLGEERSRTA